MKKITTIALLSAALVFPASAATLTNVVTGLAVSPFGSPETSTYGQVFTAPVTGTLDSFTLWLNSGGLSGSLFGGVGTWNGSAAFSTGFGSPVNLYQSANTAIVPSGSSYTFMPSVSVVAGMRYVAYLSVFGTGTSGSTSMPLGTNAPGIEYFVWNNSGDARNNPTWDYGFNAGNAQFHAEFTEAVPEPATWLTMILGLGVIGVSQRRRAKVQ